MSCPENTSINKRIDTKYGAKIKTRIEPPFKITGSFSRNIQGYSGVTASSEFITNTILGHTLKRLFGGKIRIQSNNL